MFYIQLEMNKVPIMVNMDEAMYFVPDTDHGGARIYMAKQVVYVDNDYEEIRDKVVKRQGYTAYSSGH